MKRRRGFWGAVAIAAVGLVATGCACEPVDDPGCHSDDDCPRGEVCRGSGVCGEVECRTDDECGSGHICAVDFTCREGCRYDDDCPTGRVCGDRTAWFSDDHANECVPAPECRTDADCAQYNVCEFETCESGCRSSADCPPYAFCPAPDVPDTGTGEVPPAFDGLFRHACQSGCREDSSCSEGETCDQGTCYTSCATDADCTEGRPCVVLTAFMSVSRDSNGEPRSCVAGRRCMCLGQVAPDAGVAPEAGSGPDGGAGADGAFADGGASTEKEGGR